MIPACSRCGNWIERNNRTYPGFCAPGCFAADRQERDQVAAERAAARREARAWSRGEREPSWLT